jgi:hypothetical protein
MSSCPARSAAVNRPASCSPHDLGRGVDVAGGVAAVLEVGEDVVVPVVPVLDEAPGVVRPGWAVGDPVQAPARSIAVRAVTTQAAARDGSRTSAVGVIGGT